MASKSTGSGEAKAPVIIALVFFVLATIGLGVFAYMTFEDLTAAKAEAKKAGEEKTAKEKQAQIAGEEVLLYKAALGVLTDKDREALQGSRYKTELQAAHAAMTKAIGEKSATAIADSQKLFVGAGAFSVAPESFFRWDWPAGADVPAPPAASVLDNAVKNAAQRELNERNTKTEQDRLKSATQTMIAKETEKNAAMSEFKDKTRALPGQIAAESAKIKQGYDEKAKDFETQSEQSRNTVATASKKQSEAEFAFKKATERIGIQDRKIEELTTRELDLIDPFQFDKPQGKIIRRYSDTLVDIDLGSADKLRPGIAFSLFPSDTLVRGMQPRMRPFKDQDGKQALKPIPKGKIEVVEVTGANSATCRIIDEDSPVRDRIIPGDLLYNALWRKGTSEHVALFGIFDMDGDGRDDTPALIQGLAKIGVTVDNYFDFTKLDWHIANDEKGGITSQTNFGIEGYYPTVGEADGNRNIKIEIINKTSAARKYLRERGILVLKPRDFFPRIGFNTRLDINQDAINQAATTYSRALDDKAKEGAEAPAKN